MKDEEIADKHAEEYVMREDVITENDRVPFDNGYGFQTVSFEDEVKKGYKEGFLAGLKAGRPQWHKVAAEGLPINKNDGTTYLLYTIYGEGGSPVVAHFAYRDKQQLMNVWTGAILTEDKIIAWKEIVLPKENE